MQHPTCLGWADTVNMKIRNQLRKQSESLRSPWRGWPSLGGTTVPACNICAQDRACHRAAKQGFRRPFCGIKRKS